ncbi:hypothetical protein E2C01_021368 [Portunus trituberculatus]|uniref:Uncharacterized protein n=1 Tax=Portunus trituberculatus TaxID=210409 RepID=A0A5B7E5W5_PORTR|nr:hypothetical protein [Portunus trituberculatus]
MFSTVNHSSSPYCVLRPGVLLELDVEFLVFFSVVVGRCVLWGASGPLVKRTPNKLSQQGPVAQSDSSLRRQVTGSQHGSMRSHSSLEPQSHCSPSSTRPLPQWNS